MSTELSTELSRIAEEEREVLYGVKNVNLLFQCRDGPDLKFAGYRGLYCAKKLWGWWVASGKKWKMEVQGNNQKGNY